MEKVERKTGILQCRDPTCQPSAALSIPFAVVFECRSKHMPCLWMQLAAASCVLAACSDLSQFSIAAVTTADWALMQARTNHLQAESIVLH